MIKFYLFVVFLSFLCVGCNDYKPKEPVKNNIYESQTISLGKKLSKQYCSSCHAYPEPKTLDKKTWEQYMLPRMGYMLGIYNSPKEREALFEVGEGGELVRASGLFPEEPIIDTLDWQAIKKYYIEEAPVVIYEKKSPQVTIDTSFFKVKIPSQKVPVPSTTLAQFRDNGQLLIGDATTQSYSLFSNTLQLLQSATILEGAVSVFEKEDAFWVTFMGSFSPTDAPKGMIAQIPLSTSKKASAPITNLQRPVHASYGDLNGDGLEDVVVCEFGKWTGALSYFEATKAGGYLKKSLANTPGAIKAYIKDMNADGKLDVVALFAQGDERIVIYYNDGKGNFKQDRVLQFSPSMGSSFFNLVDYNKDGFDDIVYTAGDNADYSPILKPWHGVYVFLNDGNNQFKEQLFLHLNGAYNAIVNDFDGDGQLDIAAISFFPDYVNNPNESFVLFKNIGENQFERYTIPQATKGRWVVMDGYDYDNDGDLDLVLGSLAFEVVPKMNYVQQWMDEGIPFIMLENLSIP